MLVKSKLMRRGLFKTHKMNTNNTRTYYVLLYDDTLFRTLNAFDEHPKYHRPKQHFEETSKKKKKKTRASVLLFPKSLCLRLSLRRRRRGPPTTKERNRQRRPLSRRLPVYVFHAEWHTDHVTTRLASPAPMPSLASANGPPHSIDFSGGCLSQCCESTIGMDPSTTPPTMKCAKPTVCIFAYAIPRSAPKTILRYAEQSRTASLVS